jgi:hypothetical protein
MYEFYHCIALGNVTDSTHDYRIHHCVALGNVTQDIHYCRLRTPSSLGNVSYSIHPSLNSNNFFENSVIHT